MNKTFHSYDPDQQLLLQVARQDGMSSPKHCVTFFG